jgi:regulator of replication initiation timing
MRGKENAMGEILDMLREIPLSAVLKERLVDKEAEIAALKSKIAILEEENAALKAENAELKTKLQQIESDETVHGDICPYCKQPKAKLLDIKPCSGLGRLGVKKFYYQCENCGKKYDNVKVPS